MIRCMERITVRIFREADSHPKKFGACYERENGERGIITAAERSSQIAKEKATLAVHECEWERFTVRRDGVLDVGHGWIAEPEAT